MKTTFFSIIIFLLAINSFSQNLHPTGLKSKTLKDYSFVKKSEIRTDGIIPSSVDHSANIPPVGNQGAVGSCVGWATGYYYKTYQEFEDYGWSVFDQSHIFSPSFVYNHINGGMDYGAFFEDAFKLLLENGCATYKDFPYTTYINKWPSEQIYFDALKYRSNEFFYIDASNLTGIQQLKQHIADGHVAVLGIDVFPNFDNIAAYNFNYASADKYGSSRGGHAVTILGYDDNHMTHDGPGAFRLVNSWGAGWGQSGYFWMSYAAVMDWDLSGREGYYTTDKIHYNPQLISRVKITHGSRFKLKIKFGIGANCSPLWSKDFFHFWMGAHTNVAFPNNKLVFDLTDGISFIYPNTDNRIFIVCRDTVPDGYGGRIDTLSGTNLNWNITAFSNEVPATIYDTLISIYAGFSLGPNLTTNVGITSIDINEYEIPGTIVPKATVRNCGTLPQSFPVTFQVLQNTGNLKSVVYTSTQNVSNLQPYNNIQVSFINWNSAVGNYSLRAFTQLQHDSSSINDTLNRILTVLNLPNVPNLLAPSNGLTGLEPDLSVSWSKITGTTTYYLQLATDPLFTNIVFKDSLLTDTSKYLFLNKLTTYYWKVRANNQVGSSAFSNIWNFKTKGVASVPVQLSPSNNSTYLSIPVSFKWKKSFELTDNTNPIEKYLLEITNDTSIALNYIARVPLDTTWTEDSLNANTIYYWRVSAKNNLGWSQKSIWWKFSTASTGITKINENIPQRFNLFDNYPNPFNPATSIKFDIPRNCFVTLKIYDISGRKIDVILDRKMDAGSYVISYNADNLSSGVYFYQFNTDNYISTKKMILLK
jgi:hypothetical protein